MALPHKKVLPMKTLIVIREKDYGWVPPFFPGVHPLLLPVCNKPFIEYLVDLSILAGSKAVRIVSDGPLLSVGQYCENGSRWGIDISYASILPDDSIETVMDKNRRYRSEERILVISGFNFIRYGQRKELEPFFSAAPSGTLLQNSHGSIVLAGGREMSGTVPDTVPVSLCSLDSVGSYHRLSVGILEELPSPYVLPGYSNEPDCHIGRNVVISKGAEIVKPVVIGNNVQIMKGAAVGPSAVVGSNVIIDSESTVTRSVLLDNTYIGGQLEVSGRIAAGNTLIDPESGISVVMEDPHLMSGISSSGFPGSLISRYLVHAFIAAIFIILLCIPFLLLLPFLVLQGKWKKESKSCHSERHDRNIVLPLASVSGSGLSGRMAAALSLDRFPLLFMVLFGRIALIGSCPLEADSKDERHPSVSTGYRPAVFSYAEAEDWPAEAGDRAIVERYYASHSTMFQDMVLAAKAFLNRMHANDRQ
jgi:NDP-sugar pyrophosphorylase family protein